MIGLTNCQIISCVMKAIAIVFTAINVVLLVKLIRKVRRDR